MKELAVACAALSVALSGCTIMSTHARVPGWPELRVVEHHVPHAQMRDRCAAYAPPFSPVEACTVFYFDHGEAHVYLSKDFPSEMLRQHELLHAAGYDHLGSTAMQRLWEDWRRRAARPASASGG